MRTVPTQLSTTTRGEKTYEINAKWGESKKPPRTASTATSSRLFSYRAAQAEQTAGPLYRKTSRFNVKSRKFCPPKPQRHISIVRAAKHLGCRSYANESVPAVCLVLRGRPRLHGPGPRQNATFFRATAAFSCVTQGPDSCRRARPERDTRCVRA